MAQLMEPQAPAFYEGEILSASITAASGQLPREIVAIGEAITVTVQWKVVGAFEALVDAAILAGNWRVRVYSESLGAGSEGPIATQAVPVASGLPVVGGTPATNGRHWTANIPITVNGATIPAVAAGQVHKLIVVVLGNLPPGAPGSNDIWGFHEGPTILVEGP